MIVSSRRSLYETSKTLKGIDDRARLRYGIVITHINNEPQLYDMAVIHGSPAHIDGNFGAIGICGRSRDHYGCLSIKGFLLRLAKLNVLISLFYIIVRILDGVIQVIFCARDGPKRE